MLQSCTVVRVHGVQPSPDDCAKNGEVEYLSILGFYQLLLVPTEGAKSINLPNCKFVELKESTFGHGMSRNDPDTCIIYN